MPTNAISRMHKPGTERWTLVTLLVVSLIAAAARVHLILVFGIRYIGIDDALVQQVAIDYGQGLFREPFLYGQNYNPMLEALLAAPFVRLGGAPWIVLPIVTSILALLPFWSLTLWCARQGRTNAAFAFAAMPLLLPTEWGMITTMSRGWVHGIALIGAVPWLQGIRSPWTKHASTALTLVAALFCNVNALPLVVAISVLLLHRHARSFPFWSTGIAALVLGIAAHLWAQAFYELHPPIHPLLASDLHFDPALWRSAAASPGLHLLHMHPFGGLPAFVPLFLLLACAVFWKRKEAWTALSIIAALAIMTLALGIVKVNEGCDSVFFPRSRMFLCLPLLLAATAASLLPGASIARWLAALALPIVLIGTFIKAERTEQVIGREMAHQECAWVREAPLQELRQRCLAIEEVATGLDADLIVPIRWPGIRADHKAHFMAHFTCYACAQLVKDGLPRTYGAGFDRRYWIREAYERNDHPGRVLFIGGDPAAWRRTGALDVGRDEIDLHFAVIDTLAIDAFLLRNGIDDDLGR